MGGLLSGHVDLETQPSAAAYQRVTAIELLKYIVIPCTEEYAPLEQVVQTVEPILAPVLLGNSNQFL